jgi:hypothetical protein
MSDGPGPSDDLRESDRPPAEGGMPRWVKVFIIIAAVIAAIVIIGLLTGKAGPGGGHGPGRHMGLERALPVSSEAF